MTDNSQTEAPPPPEATKPSRIWRRPAMLRLKPLAPPAMSSPRMTSRLSQGVSVTDNNPTEAHPPAGSDEAQQDVAQAIGAKA